MILSLSVIININYLKYYGNILTNYQLTNSKDTIWKLPIDGKSPWLSADNTDKKFHYNIGVSHICS